MQVLRLANNEKKPIMSYIYEAMDRGKESIVASFNNNEVKYSGTFAIIDKRWDCQLHHSLHETGHFLYPHHFFNVPNIDKNFKVTYGVYTCIDKVSIDVEENDQALCELPIYRRVEGMFGIPSAIRQRPTLALGKLKYIVLLN